MTTWLVNSLILKLKQRFTASLHPDVVDHELCAFCFLAVLNLTLIFALSSRQFQVLNRIRLDCSDLESLCIKDQALTNESQLILHDLIIFKFVVICFYFLHSLIYLLSYICRH